MDELSALRRVMEAVPSGILLVDQSGHILTMNRFAREFLGADEALSGVGGVGDYTERTLRADGTRCPVAEYPVSICLRTRESAGPTVIGVYHPAGDLRWAEFSAIPVTTETGYGAVVTFTDITQKRAAEVENRRCQERLEQADRLTSLGLLAAGIAHEVNNPITFVLGHLALLERALGDAPARQLEHVRQAREGAERVSQIVRSLVRFAREGGEPSTPVVVADAVDAAARIVHAEIKGRARLERDVPVDLPRVLAVEGELVQVLVNLLMNAAQAIAEGDAAHNLIRVLAAAEGERVWVEVTDTGQGMDVQVKDQVFNPFFTTKDVGVGLGLGLPICRRLVNAIGGEIEVESAVGVGTTMRVWLPLAPHAPATCATAGVEPVQPGRARVLVIDDEVEIVRLLEWALHHHEVVGLTSGRAALERLLAEDFDLVLCDLMMPDVNGMDVYERALAADRAAPDLFVFMSGGAYTDRARAFLEAHGAPMLAKPFSLQEVRARVASAVVERQRRHCVAKIR